MSQNKILNVGKKSIYIYIYIHVYVCVCVCVCMCFYWLSKRSCFQNVTQVCLSLRTVLIICRGNRFLMNTPIYSYVCT